MRRAPLPCVTLNGQTLGRWVIFRTLSGVYRIARFSFPYIANRIKLITPTAIARKTFKIFKSRNTKNL